ncbi:Rpn family recombination-promoting nuclease/putative transposase [Alcaligenaceae bacterium]|nr:Rpn family recombination-promoting nuclease/putative transposase [Alcaligenaceae bacterium]
MSRNLSARPRKNAAAATPVSAPSLCNDLVFKVLFSNHLPLLSDLINAVRYPLAPITVRRVLNPTILPEDLTGKEIVLDILATDTDGQRLGIEMQLRRFLHWPQRCVFGLARNLASQLGAGRDYRDLKPVIGINLLVHDLFKAHPGKAAWHFTLRDREQPEVQLGQVLQLHIMELQKAERSGQFAGPLRAWIACLLHNLDEAAMSTITYPPVKEALKHLETLYSDEEFRLMAERRAQALVDAEDARDYAHQEGLEKGLKQGASGILEHQLSHRFGPLSAEVLHRLRHAGTEQIQAWSLNLLDAKTLEEVFRE